MPKYKVTVTAMPYTVEVEADNEHDAEEIAINDYHDGYVLDEVRVVDEIKHTEVTR
jgi:hypothetical protein